MAYCQKCGNEIDEFAIQCEKCGNPVASSKPRVIDEGGFLWGLLGFCVPVVGLILYLIWKYERPNTALAAGRGALIGVVGMVLFYILYFIFIFTYLA